MLAESQNIQIDRRRFVLAAIDESLSFPVSRQPQSLLMSRRRFVLAAMSVAATGATMGSRIFADDTFGVLTVGDAVCDYFGYESGEDKIQDTVHTFRSSRDAEDVIKSIANVQALSPKYKVLAAGVPNAAAVIRNRTRYILYSRTFMRDIERRTGTRAAGVSILAHEVGHHLNGHTLEAGGSRPSIELEADRFSGFAMRQLRYSLDDAQVAIKKLGSDRGSRTHPGKRARLEAIALGYEECDRNNSCPDTRDSGRSDSDSSSARSQRETDERRAEERRRREREERERRADERRRREREREEREWEEERARRADERRREREERERRESLTDVCCCGTGWQRFPGQSAPVGTYCQCGPDAWGNFYPGTACRP